MAAVVCQTQPRAVERHRAGSRRAKEAAGHDAVATRSGSRGDRRVGGDRYPVRAVQRWLDVVHPARAFTSRMFLKPVLLVLSDDQASSRERFEARRELYRRLISAGIMD